MIAFLIIATGKYDRFVPQLVESIERFVLPDHEIIVFTDSQDSWIGAEKIQIEHLPFPEATLRRYKLFADHEHLLTKYSHLYYIDADMKVVDAVGSEILGKLTAVLHPGFVGQSGTPERRSVSMAYIPKRDQSVYYAGGFQGGSEYLKACKVLAYNIEKDRANGVMAIWHDESHWNAYLHRIQPDVVLSPSYCYPESWDIPYHKRILALDKDHNAIR